MYLPDYASFTGHRVPQGIPERSRRVKVCREAFVAQRSYLARRDATPPYAPSVQRLTANERATAQAQRVLAEACAEEPCSVWMTGK